jgi:hypothetical protein
VGDSVGLAAPPSRPHAADNIGYVKFRRSATNSASHDPPTAKTRRHPRAQRTAPPHGTRGRSRRSA